MSAAAGAVAAAPAVATETAVAVAAVDGGGEASRDYHNAVKKEVVVEDRNLDEGVQEQQDRV